MILPICEICHETKKPGQFSVLCSSCEHSSLMDIAKGCILEIANICIDADNKQIMLGLSNLCKKLEISDFFDNEIKPKFFNIAI